MKEKRVWFITGAGRGLGVDIAKAALAAGHAVVATGRDPAKLGNALYHNINIQADRKAALAESNAFLDKYYTSNFSAAFVEGFTTAGSAKECIRELKDYFNSGLQHITLRLTSWDQQTQLRRFLEEVVPAFA